MKCKVKEILTYLMIFVAITCLQLGFLTLSACIPTENIQQNAYLSAEALTKQPMFFFASKHDYSSRIDRYADAILLNIAYCIDSEKPLTSVMRSAYYTTDTANENHNLMYAVTNDAAPTKSYARYWHGSVSVVRPLLTIFHIKQIYIISAIILFFMCVTLLFFAKKYINTKVCICLMFPLIMTSVWYVPLSLEYIWTFFIMLTASVISIHLYQRSQNLLMYLFFISGAVTCYFDFLTTETLTAVVPAILIYVMKYESGCLKDLKTEFKALIKLLFTWLSGYALSWFSKWTLASVILKENIFSDAFGQAAYRTVGAADTLTYANAPFADTGGSIFAVLKNISCIFPFSLIAKNGYIAVSIAVISLFIVLYIFQKKQKPSNLNRLLGFLAILPLLRFMLLSNHSSQHYFFTYRALFSTIFVLSLLVAYNVRLPFKGSRKA